MQGIILLIVSLLVTFALSMFNKSLKPLININNKFEYIPIINANLYADLLIIYITYTGILGRGKSWDILSKWYKKYRLSAMLADILIGVIYLLIARYIVYKLQIKLNLFQFALLAVFIQLCLDFAFYLFFKNIPKGTNDMLDLFKEWSKHAKLDALWGDSILILIGVVISAYLNTKSIDFNIFALLIGLYMTPYIIYKKD